MTNPWATADRVSDRITTVLRDELGRMRKARAVRPDQILVGQLLALKSTEATMPLTGRPSALARLLEAVDETIGEFMGARAERES